MNKSFFTNFIAVLIIIAGYLVPGFGELLLSIGFFALSGAITNWLAVHMLFEKVPFLYGSGVVPNRFCEFKEGIKKLIMGQFFNQENLDKFFQDEERTIVSKINFEDILKAFNYDKMYQDLVSVVMESSFGGMLGMFGGANALESLKQPFEDKMKTSILDVTKSQEFLDILDKSILSSHKRDGLKEKIEEVIDQRLSELTPQMVKEIVQDMIQKHLGWLVVWGGVFGGLIGFAMYFFKMLNA